MTWTAEDYDNGAALNKIDKHFINWRWDEEHYTTCASIFLDEIQINCFFFTDEQIENDIDPSQVKSLADHNKIMDYMKSISKILGKTVILTGENCPEYAVIKVNRDEIEFIK